MMNIPQFFEMAKKNALNYTVAPRRDRLSDRGPTEINSNLAKKKIQNNKRKMMYNS